MHTCTYIHTYIVHTSYIHTYVYTVHVYTYIQVYALYNGCHHGGHTLYQDTSLYTPFFVCGDAIFGVGGVTKNYHTHM